MSQLSSDQKRQNIIDLFPKNVQPLVTGAKVLSEADWRARQYRVLEDGITQYVDLHPEASKRFHLDKLSTDSHNGGERRKEGKTNLSNNQIEMPSTEIARSYNGDGSPAKGLINRGPQTEIAASVTTPDFQAQRQGNNPYPPKPSPAPTPFQKPVCYITVVARKIEQLNTTTSPAKGVGVNAYHMYVLTKQSGENYQQIHHGFPNSGQLKANTADFDERNWDYTDTKKVGYLGSVEAVSQVAGSCAPIRENFNAAKDAINNANIPYEKFGNNSNSVAYTFISRLGDDVAGSLNKKLLAKLAIHSVVAPNNIPHTPPIIPGWGRDLLRGRGR
jgi:hypothetical protein